MLGDSSGTPTRPPSRLLLWWANHSHRYVIPVVGVVSTSLGISLALDPSIPWRTYAPPLLTVLGASALASGVAALALRRRHARQYREASPPLPRSVATAGPMPSDRTSGDLPEVSDGRWRDVPRVHRSGGHGTTLTIPNDPGNYLWQSWATPSGFLPAELVGPVPETAYMPSPADAPDLYEAGEPIFLGPAAGVTPIGPTTSTSFGKARVGAPGQFSTTEVSDASAEETDGLPGWTNSASSRGLPSYVATARSNPVHHEALNPTPPHLRPRTAPSRAVAPGHRPAPRAIERGVRCATCHETEADPKEWRRCSDCQRHLCADCIVSALLSYQRGWCSDCAHTRNPDLAAVPASPRSHRRRATNGASTAEFPTSAGSTGVAS